MKVTVIILFVVAALLLASSFALISEGVAYVVVGVVMAAVPAIIGLLLHKRHKLSAQKQKEAEENIRFEKERPPIAAPKTSTPMPRVTISGATHRPPATSSRWTLPEEYDGYKLKYQYDDVKLAISENFDCFKFGDEVIFKPEPENVYDDNAVAVYVDSGVNGLVKIGYLFRGKLQDMFHDFINNDNAVRGRVAFIEPNEEKGDMIGLLVGFYARA